MLDKSCWITVHAHLLQIIITSQSAIIHQCVRHGFRFVHSKQILFFSTWFESRAIVNQQTCTASDDIRMNGKKYQNINGIRFGCHGRFGLLFSMSVTWFINTIYCVTSNNF